MSERRVVEDVVNKKRYAYGSIIKILLTASILISVIIVLKKCSIFNFTSPTQLKEFLSRFGMYSPVIYIVLFTIVPLTLFPDSILAIGGGLAFGLAKGSIYTMIGALCGATLSFYISRILGKEIVYKLTKGKIQELGNRIKEKGFNVILLLRLIPLFPFDIISYSAGLSGIRYRDFISATFIGVIPGIIVFTNIGDKAAKIGSVEFYISISLLMMLILLSKKFKKVIDKK